MTKANFGVVGMAVMGRNLALNIESRGYTVAIFNRSKEKTEDVIACHPDKNFVPSYDSNIIAFRRDAFGRRFVSKWLYEREEIHR